MLIQLFCNLVLMCWMDFILPDVILIKGMSESHLQVGKFLAQAKGLT